ncbi:hypothetical protein BDB01DRAFT_781074 [Pilobolus umbonatus]|nr:hypothetical protein BDB01DRAFT_781074 [Pilobolus umbonatus]
MLGFKDRKREIFCFYIEIKRPGKDSKYQEEDDFVKLMELMKFSFNRQITLGIKNPLAFGLLCQGFTSSLYKMTLKEDGIYMPIMVKRFSLVGDKSELMNVPLIVEAFGMVKVCYVLINGV